MSVWQELIGALAEYGKAQCGQAVRKARTVGVSLVACVMAAILALWGLGLLIAALLIALAPHVGAACAAAIAAGAAFLGAAVLGLVATLVRR